MVRYPELADVEYLAQYLRWDDIQECEAVGLDPLTAIWDSLSQSHRAFVVEQEGVPVLIFGICRDHTIPELNVGIIWMMGTRAITNFYRLFLRHSKEWMETISQGYDFLWNFVDVRNKVHHRWLKWCGFTFLRVVPRGPKYAPFYEFVKPCAT